MARMEGWLVSGPGFTGIALTESQIAMLKFAGLQQAENKGLPLGPHPGSLGDFTHVKVTIDLEVDIDAIQDKEGILNLLKTAEIQADNAFRSWNEMIEAIE